MAEEKKNRSEELESLDKKINEIINGWNQNPEEIVEFLQFSSKFSYAYSPRNMMLIAQPVSYTHLTLPTILLV